MIVRDAQPVFMRPARFAKLIDYRLRAVSRAESRSARHGIRIDELDRFKAVVALAD